MHTICPVIVRRHTHRLRMAWIALSVFVCLLVRRSCLQRARLPFRVGAWRPDPYRLVLFHRGPLSEADRALISPLVDEQDQSANLDFPGHRYQRVGRRPGLRFLCIYKGIRSSRGLVARYPEHLTHRSTGLRGTVERNSLARLSDSPVRHELVKRLVDGQTAVWLFLDSGLPEKDDAAARCWRMSCENRNKN